MPRRGGPGDDNCAIARSLDVVGDAWTLLILRDVARGLHRFDLLQHELGLSRKVLTERLHLLVDAEVLAREPYQDRPPRYEYRLTPRGRALLPVLVALQDWGDTWLLGPGETTATADPGSQEAERVHALLGTRVPELLLADTTGQLRDPVAGRTVLYCFPGAFVRPESYPPGWGTVPGAAGCTLESRSYQARLAEFAAVGATVHGVSTQRTDEQRAFAAAEGLDFPLLSDAGLELTAALRLPTVRAGGTTRLKRLTLVIGPDRVIRQVMYPVPDILDSVDAALRAVSGPIGCAQEAASPAGS
ncbi:winged helix-turn-helix transcriptional regulator [Kitasatospora sp. NPDC101801]|uniref:winged helix-turn-helix transcriptional regulator n=1 Tax=Kitasatospora sp. NPDC101801 TaxID=3364103 RepID=UPI0037F1C47E